MSLAVENWKDKICNMFLRWLKEDYKQETSNKAVIEYLYDNDKEFLKDGREWGE